MSDQTQVSFDQRAETVLRELLSDQQLHGIACAYCGAPGGAMKPIGYGPLGQLFIHDHDCERSF
jgi:hypothetical protein